MTIACGMLLAIAWPAGLASAHAELAESSPLAGEHLDQSPALITLRFTESVALLDDAVRLLDNTGTEVALDEPSVDGSVVTVGVPPLADGGYVVDWQVVSADGHPVSGAFTFAVGDAALPDQPDDATGNAGQSSTDTALLAIARAGTYAGFALALGVWGFVIACWADGRRDKGVSILVAIGSGLAAASATARLLLEMSVFDASFADTVALQSGKAWLALVVLAVASLAIIPAVRSRLSKDVQESAWWLSAVAVGTAIAFAGHGASGRVAILGTVATIVHVGAACLWIGGLAGLVRCLTVAEPSVAEPAAGRFSRVAFWSVVTLLATGIVQAVRQLHSVDALTNSDFGQALIVKFLVVLVLVGVAWVSRRLLRARAITQGDTDGTDDANQLPPTLRRAVGVELGLAVLVFGATGWLAGASPIPDEGGNSGPITVTAPDTTGDATVTVTIGPATVGTNVMHMYITGAHTEPPDEVTIELTPADAGLAPIDIDASVFADHSMSEPFEIPYAGRWDLTINARYGDFEVETFEVAIDVG